MWFFKRRVTYEEFRLFKEDVEKHLVDLRDENKELRNKLEVLHNKVVELAPLSNHFTELQKQFIDVVKQVSTQPMRREGKQGEARAIAS